MRGHIRKWAIILSAFPPGSSLAQTAEQRAAIENSMEIGTQLYRHDMTSYLTTNLIRERFGDPNTLELRGYIVEQRADDMVITYYRQVEDGWEGVIRGVGSLVDDSVTIELIDDPAARALNAEQVRTIEARERFRDISLTQCREGDYANSFYNIVALPPEEDGSVAVYFLTHTNEGTDVPYSGHNRAVISPSGEILSVRPFTNSCLMASTAPNEEGNETVGLMVSHSLDPVPSEIHVYLSLHVGIPIDVLTADRTIWRVDGGRITLMGSFPEAAPNAANPTNSD